MAKNRNCPNCGAPYDPALNKCPYCGTIYFDMSCIDFEAGTPIYLKMRLPGWAMHFDDAHSFIITQKAVPMLDDASITLESENEYCRVGNGTSAICFKQSQTLTTKLLFRSVPMDDGDLLRMEVAE